jgi:hypothetical protein
MHVLHTCSVSSAYSMEASVKLQCHTIVTLLSFSTALESITHHSANLQQLHRDSYEVYGSLLLETLLQSSTMKIQSASRQYRGFMIRRSSVGTLDRSKYKHQKSLRSDAVASDAVQSCSQTCLTLMNADSTEQQNNLWY